jgi:predicted transcriptional regulator
MTEITEYITNDVKAIDSFDSIAAVQNFFSDLHFSHFPVLEEGVYIGSAAEDIETLTVTKK